MKLSIDHMVAAYTIKAYEPGEIKVNDQTLTRSLVVMPDSLKTDWAPACFEDLTLEHLLEVAAMKPEIILLGTGEKQQFPPHSVIAEIVNRGIGFEVMDTQAAARTWNILAGEGRNVAGALIIG